MKGQKTRKGQPLMRNYIKYALTQLQLTIKQEQQEKQAGVAGGREGKGQPKGTREEAREEMTGSVKDRR